MKVKVTADDFDSYRARALARAKRLASGERLRPEVTINFDSPTAMFEVMTTERIRLCEVARTGTFSVSGLAAALKRDPKSVRRDVAKLEQAGLVRTREEVSPGHGRKKIVEPVAERFELRASF
jgi:predicted transcriptional regulator